MKEKPIYVTGYPKSGTTWLTRLLGDVLYCPTGGSIPREDRIEIATEGLDRTSDYVVRKGHFIIAERSYTNGRKRPHVLTEFEVERNSVIHIIRDPRDIAVSASFHWNYDLEQIVRNMITGENNFRFCGAWSEYVLMWLPNSVLIRYEDLLASGPFEIARILRKTNFNPDEYPIEEAYERQKFSVRKAHIEKHGQAYNLGREFNLNFMRKGVSGDWSNHFSKSLAFEFEAHFGELLRKFEYEKDELWWKNI